MSKPNGRESIRLAVTDFGPIARAEVDLRPLTVFIGPSNTGKSYLAILIYALHSLFPIDRFSRSRLRNIRWQDAIPTEDAVKRLAACVNESLSESPGRRHSFDGPVPEVIASMIRPILADASGGTILRDEIGRCFGIGSDTRRLIRNGSRNSANVVLQKGPFQFDLAITGRNHRFSATIPADSPLLMASDKTIRNMASLWRILQIMDSDRGRFLAMDLIENLTESVAPQVVGELSHPAFYLPADRAGVMHAHRVVVSALVERSASAGLRNAHRIPTLSGVLADFLEQLINIDDRAGETSRHGTDFAKEIERDILQGAVRIDLSETR